jgi:glutamate---cysteine ligase / carboxylate-amine ligase
MSEAFTLGVEEEFHVVDRTSRELVPRGAEILRRLPAGAFAAELQGSVVESNSRVHTSLSELREDLVGLRRRAGAVADAAGLALVSAGSVPLVDLDALEITPTSRYRRMLDDYQILAREQLICGMHTHVGVSDRDAAVAVAHRVAPWLHLLLALSVSSPYWMGEDSGYASVRALVWQRWPTAGATSGATTAAEHDALVADLIASGIISDQAMIYFDVRPSADKPTIELRVADACTEVDDAVLIAGLFRAMVRHALANPGAAHEPVKPPLLRAAMWRAARSGLDGDLLDLPTSPKPLPAALAIGRMLDVLRPYLEETGDRDTVTDLIEATLARGGSASRQRRVYARRGRLTDVVDLLVERTRGAGHVLDGPRPGVRLTGYHSDGDEVFGPATVGYRPMLEAFERLGPAGLRQREQDRDEEQRAQGVTFTVGGDPATRLFPFDLVPRIVSAADWADLGRGLTQRARALDALLRDVYGQRQAIADGIVPAWVVDSAPGLRPTGALVPRDRVRAHLSGMDLVRDAAGWYVLEDNLRVPSGMGYAVQNRRLTRAVLPELTPPPGLLDVDAAPTMLRETLAAASHGAGEPCIAVLSGGPSDSAWFEHRLLAGEMGVPLVRTGDLLVDDRIVYVTRDGTRRRVDVLYLRVDEDHLLHAAGADGRPLGPSLLAAVYAGTVTLANALGNGVGDDKAVYAYVPELIAYYLGERSLLAQVPTFLCGVAEQRDEVLGRLDRLVCKPVDGYGGDRVLIGPTASDEEIAAVRRQIEAAPHRWIAQEPVALSTNPVFDGTGYAPRHVDLRAFVFLTGHGARTAPAALTRVAPAGSMIVNSSRGGGSKDTWLMEG